MSVRICLTPDDAFEAGYTEPCEHLVPDPEDCPQCRLTDAEIGRLAALLHSEAASYGSGRKAA
jgi:hypothetical protein